MGLALTYPAVWRALPADIYAACSSKEFRYHPIIWYLASPFLSTLSQPALFLIVLTQQNQLFIIAFLPSLDYKLQDSRD